MSNYRDIVSPSAPSEHLLGRVKWFNNKAGYGFITVTDGSRSGTDIFVHHSSINVENQQYKYLVQGEYVEFDLIKVDSAKHEWQASSVSGIRGGKLMCETRRDLKLARNEYRTTKSSDEPAATEPKMPRQRSNLKQVESKPRTGSNSKVRREVPRNGEKKEWTLVTNGKSSRKQSGKNTIRSTQGSTVITIESK